MQNIVLINGRYELLNSPDRIDVFDIRNLKKDETGLIEPLGVIPLHAEETDLEAGRLALEWLQAHEYITQAEHLNYLESFITSHPVLARRLSGENSKNEESVRK